MELNIYEMIKEAYNKVEGAGAFESLPGNVQRDITMQFVNDLNKALDKIH